MQAETCVLAQMQLKQHRDAAAKECDGLRSQLAAQAAAADENAAQHTAELEAARQTVSSACVLVQPHGLRCARTHQWCQVRSVSSKFLAVHTSELSTFHERAEAAILDTAPTGASVPFISCNCPIADVLWDDVHLRCLACIVISARACSSMQAQRELEAQQAALESLWQNRVDAEVALARGRMQEEHSAQTAERAAYLGALHAGRLRSMQDAHLLQRHQLQAGLLEAHELHAQQLEHVRQESILRESCMAQEHAAALQQTAEEHAHALAHAAADAEERANLRLAEVSAASSPSLLASQTITLGKMLLTHHVSSIWLRPFS